MKTPFLIALAFLLGGCDQLREKSKNHRRESGHYAIASAADGGAYFLDTRTGALRYCRAGGPERRVACGPATDLAKRTP